MVIYNAATRELTAKIVYYGPGLCGKTTNLKVLHDRLEPGTAGKLLNLQTQTDRTIYFDLLPVELGDIKGYKIRFQLATVPGQTAFNETRRVVLKGVDGIVFVADSQWTMLPKNLESWQNLKDNLKSNEISFEKIPVVIQYNKRDLADILAVDAMQEALGLSSYPFVEAVASAGRGVTETFKLISKLTFVDLLRRLQGKRAEEANAPAVAAAEEARPDDLQTWKDSLLKRESQAAANGPRPSRPLVLVPPVSDEAPFDTTELAREAEADDADGASPYAVPEPPGMGMGTPIDLAPPPIEEPVDAIEIEIPTDEPEEAEEAPELLSEADAIEAPNLAGHATDPAFLPPEAVASSERLALLEERLREAEGRAGREREVAERLDRAISSLEEHAAETKKQVAEVGDRCRTMENSLVSLQEALGSFMGRLGNLEQAAARQSSAEASQRGLEAAVQSLEERLRAETSRQRKDADDVAMALSSLTERTSQVDAQIGAALGAVGSQADQLSSLRHLAEALPRLEGQLGALAGLAGLAEQVPGIEGRLEAVLRHHRELEAMLEEKNQQGRREAEDIRSQIAPLLEERVRRHESDALLFSEMERLRESLAESLHDLAERLRNAVRE